MRELSNPAPSLPLEVEGVGASSFWSRALGLKERIDGRKRAVPTEADPSRILEGRLRMAEWRESMLAGRDLFHEKLQRAGLSSEDFAQLLAEGPEMTLSAEGETWRLLAEEILADRYSAEPLPLIEPHGGSPGEIPFSGLLRPLLQTALHRLRCGVAELERRVAAPLLTPLAEAGMLQALAERVFAWAGPTLILELNVARVEGRLRGEHPHERLQDFSERILGAPEGRLRLFAEYPVLARLLATAVEQWSETMLELVERFAADRKALAEAFAMPERVPHSLLGVKGGLSDSHRRGRSVLRVDLTSGLTLIYKPKSMAVESRFQNLLGWLQDAGLRHPHRRLRVLDRGAYGWVEFVLARPCKRHEEIERFFWRQGSFLALLYVLRAADFHHENLIAADEHPVLVDLESLFHHRMTHAADPNSALALARRKLDESVFGLGLLPVLTWGGKGRKGVDLSGLGGRKGESYPHPMPMLIDASSDMMRIERRDVQIASTHNRPTLDGLEIDPTQHVEDLVKGFRETYALLVARRDELEAQVRELAALEMRHIARPTMRYALFLQESFHPDYLRDALDRERLLDKLWAEATFKPDLARLVPSEQEDLRRGDIPFFTFLPYEHDLRGSRGEIVNGFFPETSWRVVEDRIRHLGDKDCEEQTEFIRQSMLVLDAGHTVSQQAPAPTKDHPAGQPSREEYLAAATKIGEALKTKAILGQDDVSWIAAGLRADLDWRWLLAPLESGLYEGLGGLALFFAHLGAATRRGDFEDLARRCTRSLERFMDADDPPGASNVGVFSGRSGQLYVFNHLAALWHEPSLLDRALASLPKIDEQIERDRNLDVMGGAAGCAVVLLDLHRQTGEDQLLASARRCGERLLSQSQPTEPAGLGWIGSSAAEPLAGFSHGVAGIAWALLRLADALGDERFRNAALQGLIYERSLFVPESRNWIDLRRFEQAPKDFKSVAWCHGAPGVALGRLLGLSWLDDPDVREEIRLGIEETLASGFGGSHSLCHGDLGNADIVLFAAEVMNRPDWRNCALEATARVWRQVQAGDHRCGLPRFTETPGLMTGLSGIGYGLLRVAVDGVPDVLRLTPPAVPGE